MGKYDDIINLPHHQSDHRPHMSLHDRAAQFSPFAALTGYEAAIEEAVKTASLVAQEDDIVLYSPACHSYKGKENYETRGNRFTASVKDLQE